MHRLIKCDKFRPTSTEIYSPIRISNLIKYAQFPPTIELENALQNHNFDHYWPTSMYTQAIAWKPIDQSGCSNLIKYVQNLQFIKLDPSVPERHRLTQLDQNRPTNKYSSHSIEASTKRNPAIPLSMHWIHTSLKIIWVSLKCNSWWTHTHTHTRTKALQG